MRTEERVMRYSFLGPEGTFCEQALAALPETRNAELRPATTVLRAFDDVTNGVSEAALVPLENSVEGSVRVTLDRLIDGDDLMIVREVLLPVTFGLYARSGSRLPQIATVATHPHAEAQCRKWLAAQVPYADMISVSSTADAARSVKRGEFDAAICAPAAGRLYGLTELATDVADNRGAVTRFVLVKQVGPPPPSTGNDLTSLVVFIAEDRSGALLEVLTQFAAHSVNLTRIESRPTKERLGRYCFFVDCEGHLEDHPVAATLEGLRQICSQVRYLGSYPRAELRPEG